MKNLSSQLTSVDKHVEELRKDFEESMRGAAQIKIDLDREQAAIQVSCLRRSTTLTRNK